MAVTHGHTEPSSATRAPRACTDAGSVWLTRISWAVVLAVAAYFLLLPVRDFLIRFSIGDALAYPRIAFNVASGQGSTYDGLTRTNGYHPLWMWLHVPLMLGADSVMGRMALVRILWVGTTLAAVFCWSRFIFRLTASRLATAILALVMGAFGWSLYVLYAGVETPLFLGLLGLALSQADTLVRRPAPGIASCAAVGVVMACAFLARLDGVFVLAPLALVVADRLRRVSWRHLVAWAVPAGGLPAPYLWWNLTTFGGIVPVSGRVKSVDGFDLARTVAILRHWADRRMPLLPDHSGFVLIVASCVGAGALVWIVRRLHADGRGILRVLWVLPFGAVAHYVYYLIKMREINIAWHLFLQFQTVYVFLALLGHLVATRPATASLPVRRSAAFQFAIFSLVAALTGAGTFFYVRAKSVARPGVALTLRVADWINTHVPKGTRIAMYDSFTLGVAVEGLHIVDLNGLVGDGEMAALAKRKNQAEIIDNCRCEYAITWITADCFAEGTGDAYLFVSDIVGGGVDSRLAIVDADAYKQARGRDGPGPWCLGSVEPHPSGR